MIRRKKIIIILTIIFVLLQITITTNAQTQHIITVDKNGNGDYTTIQEAIDNAAEKSIIHVKKGIYSEILNIKKQITIIGEDKVNTIINPISKKNKYAVCLGAPGATIEGFTISNGAPGLYTNAVRITSTEITIKNCDIHDTPVGIAIFTSYNTVENCKFWKCEDEGIVLLGSKHSNCGNNKIINCEFYENCDGIELQYSSNNQITNCKFYDNTHTGIDAIASSNDRNIIENCEIYNNRVHGIYLASSSENQIIKCKISDNKDGNIMMNEKSKNNIITPRIYERPEEGLRSSNIEETKYNTIETDEDKQDIVTRILYAISKLKIYKIMPFSIFNNF